MEVRIEGTAVKAYAKWPHIVSLIQHLSEGCQFPCIGKYKGEHGDMGEPVVELPNGKEISIKYLQIAE